MSLIGSMAELRQPYRAAPCHALHRLRKPHQHLTYKQAAARAQLDEHRGHALGMQPLRCRHNLLLCFSWQACRQQVGKAGLRWRVEQQPRCRCHHVHLWCQVATAGSSMNEKWERVHPTVKCPSLLHPYPSNSATKIYSVHL